jgi:hypothetical protein
MVSVGNETRKTASGFAVIKLWISREGKIQIVLESRKRNRARIDPMRRTKADRISPNPSRRINPRSITGNRRATFAVVCPDLRVSR